MPLLFSAVYAASLTVPIKATYSEYTGWGEDPVVVDAPPFPPDGVFSITGDGVVSIFWNPNQEPDLEGYFVYRSVANPGPYYAIDGARLSAGTTSYDDFDVDNGETWFYAAIDARTRQTADYAVTPAFWCRRGCPVQGGRVLF